MSEALYMNKKQLSMAEQTTTRAFDVVDEQFSDGKQRHGRNHLRFHNGLHARMVSMGAVALGQKLGLSPAEQVVARVAGAAHDIVQLRGPGVNEDESAEWLDNALAEHLPPEAITMGRLAILGTEPIFKDGIIVSQKANTQKYPSKQAELLAKAVACADLGALYKPEGPLLGHELYREISGHNQRNLPPIDEDIVAFQKKQTALIMSYVYPLKKANTLLATHRSKVEKHTSKHLSQLEAGEIHSWKQLIEQDRAFQIANS
ncbi:MAG TPA: hypothetical protein VK502_00845 [Candidatus Saccharimonadales bacterium]|nr:hypothetical protein [Candidatus Saccharimonadales bacterium]